MHTLIATLFVLLVLGAAIGLSLNQVLLSRLRFRHPDIWEAIGAPSKVFDDGGSASLRSVQKVLRNAEFQARCGVDVVRLARLTRVYDRAYLTVAVVTLLGCLYLVRRYHI
jgi:hypothetical protein